MTMHDNGVTRHVLTQSAEMAAILPVFDRANQMIWKGHNCTQLSPKAYAVLDFLHARPNTLASKDELLDSAWPNVCVGDAVLKNAVRELRQALDDDPCTPRFIETVYRRGYRFVGNLPLAENSSSTSVLASDATKSRPQIPAARTHEWQQLNDYWQRACAGERQLVFIDGEPGVGKSALLTAWQEHLTDTENVLCVRGHCQQHFANDCEYRYLPILDVLGQLCRGPEQQRVIDLLERYAPNWLQQLPWLHQHTQPAAATGTEPSLLELVAFIEALSHETALLLVLEDVHWSDAATLDLLAFLAHRAEPAQLAIICTLSCCAENAATTLPRIRQELLLHGCCQEITLNFYTPSDLTGYLSQRCPELEFGQDFCTALYRLTEGHPQFVDYVVDTLLAEKILQRQDLVWDASMLTQALEAALPLALKHTLRSQQELLSARERRVLEAASVFEHTFLVSELATLMDQQELEIEEICENLVARSFWLHRLERDEHSRADYAQLYSFKRVLYRRYVFAGIQAARRQRLQNRLDNGRDSKTSACDLGVAGGWQYQLNLPATRLAYAAPG